MADSSVPDKPDHLVVDSPYEVANWRPLVHWAMFIPHGIIVSAMRSASSAVFFVYWVMLVVTGRLHRGLYGFMAMHERYNERGFGFLVGFSEQYPPFEFSLGGSDDEAYPPIRVDLPEPPETASRTAAFNILLAIPHYVVIVLLAIAAVVVLVIGWFAVLFTGAWPQGLRDFLVRFTNYYLRVWVYVAMADSRYPRFGL